MEKQREGECFYNKQGELAKIIKYNNAHSCDIQFEDGTILYDREYKDVKKGGFSNYNYKSIYGVGYLGGNICKYPKYVYNRWRSLLERCYKNIKTIKNKSYDEVLVCEEWHNFQNFAHWFENNYIEGFELDKDILVKGSKIYSPETCCFVPQEINKLFTKRKNDRGDYPIGVIKNRNKYIVQISKNNKRVRINGFKTPEEAFQTYKTEKEKYIKEVADKWRGQIMEDVYQAMCQYQVEITD